MVGDGINGAPALERASTSIAMGAAGTDVPIETADIAWMHDDISKVNYLIKLSEKTMSVMKENVAVSLLIKGSFVFFRHIGIFNPLDGRKNWRYGIKPSSNPERVENWKWKINN